MPPHTKLLSRLIRRCSGAILLTILLCAAVPGAAQTPAAKTQPSAIPRLPNGKPDFNGVWERPYVPDMSRDAGANQKGPGAIPFTPEYTRIFKEYDPAKFDYTGHCLPQGLTRSMNSPFPIRIHRSNQRDHDDSLRGVERF